MPGHTLGIIKKNMNTSYSQIYNINAEIILKHGVVVKYLEFMVLFGT